MEALNRQVHTVYLDEAMKHQRSKPLYLLLAAILSAAAVAQAPKNIVGETVTCPAAKTQPCASDACASTCTVSVTLPAGATYVASHYFTNADYPSDRATTALYESGAKEAADARWFPAEHAANPNGQVVVTARYSNRANRARYIVLKADYQ
jgi:hypothetical protein